MNRRINQNLKEEEVDQKKMQIKLEDKVKV
jgi:hypothetical protein